MVGPRGRTVGAGADNPLGAAAGGRGGRCAERTTPWGPRPVGPRTVRGAAHPLEAAAGWTPVERPRVAIVVSPAAAGRHVL